MESEKAQEVGVNPEDQGAVIGVAVSEEALHGDWLVVKRKKKGGNERKKGGAMDKGKISGNQSVSGEAKNQPKIPRKEKEGIGNPNLLTFPSTALSLATSNSRGKSQDNGKKRARKDTHKKDDVEEGKLMHDTELVHVQLIDSTRKDREVTLGQHVNIEKEGVVSTGHRKESTMKGFDLGHEIVISPNLLGGLGAQSSKGGKPKGRPPDLKAKGKSDSRGSGSTVDDSGDDIVREPFSMVLDSGQ
ncbi:hypothetical protein RIF29_31216 [Crotalaria pallida]|uniref:Uncharacterized protein n=1 Tax=Crotalaria pallida TaxID=3830 RepID=A0AAN9EJ56_CROPI